VLPGLKTVRLVQFRWYGETERDRVVGKLPDLADRKLVNAGPSPRPPRSGESEVGRAHRLCLTSGFWSRLVCGGHLCAGSGSEVGIRQPVRHVLLKLPDWPLQV